MLIKIKIILFHHSKRKDYEALYKIMGFFARDIRLYEEALLHKSSATEENKKHYHNNERLEFLGDAILDSVVAEILYIRFPNRNEGFLTDMRSKIVQRETMDQMARRLGLNQLIISSNHLKNQKNHITGNALEAFIGAIYLDQGYKQTQAFIEKQLLTPYINMETLARKEVNFKSKLLEWSQKHKVILIFEVIDNYTDSDSNSIFQSRVLLNGFPAGIGTGHSKKKSHQQAAQVALQKVENDIEFREKVFAANTECVKPVNQTDTIIVSHYRLSN